MKSMKAEILAFKIHGSGFKMDEGKNHTCTLLHSIAFIYIILQLPLFSFFYFYFFELVTKVFIERRKMTRRQSTNEQKGTGV